MANIKSIIDNLKEEALGGSYQKILRRNALTKELFDFLFKGNDLRYDLLLLCTREGLILSCYSPYLKAQLSGYSISVPAARKYEANLKFHERLGDFLLITAGSSDNDYKIRKLLGDLKLLLDLYFGNEENEKYLLDCLDSVENAICIYDKDAHFLYGNLAHCKNMHIDNREAAIGMHILDITKKYGIKIHATKNNSDNLKMLDVLKSGKKALDWEVKIESETDAGKAGFVSNNMYPIKDTAGQVKGLVEVAYSHQLNLNKTKKIMGLTAEYTFDSIVGSSPEITEKINQAKEYANNPYNLLIVGESGVGKELFAQSIHNYSHRKNEPFVALNCASFPENLIESELFGYVGGAFTGASKSGQIGKFELADGGTLFLDEIGELPFHFQSKLLRVLENRKITRIGSTTETPINVRVIAATNRDLEKMIAEGLFREDLYYRLQVLTIEIPPLRVRKTDILELADSFFNQVSEATGEPAKSLELDAKECLMEYDWPGNVRELRNAIHRVSILSKSKFITREDLEKAIYAKGYSLKQSKANSSIEDKPETTPDGSLSPEDKLSECRQAVDRAYINLIKEALAISEGNKSKAAKYLDVSRKTLYRMIEKYGI